MYKKSIFAYYGFLMFHRYTCRSCTCEFLKDSTLYCEGELLSIIILPMISNSQNSSCTDLNLVDVWRLVLNFCQLLSYLITLLVFIPNSEFLWILYVDIVSLVKCQTMFIVFSSVVFTNSQTELDEPFFSLACL
jgi:hypothetical protein